MKILKVREPTVMMQHADMFWPTARNEGEVGYSWFLDDFVVPQSGHGRASKFFTRVKGEKARRKMVGQSNKVRLATSRGRARDCWTQRGATRRINNF